MLQEIRGFLEPAEIARIAGLAAATPGGAPAEAAAIVGQACDRNRLFHDFCFPRAITPPQMMKYGPGQGWETHAEPFSAGTRREPGALRCDLCYTVFLSEPDSYAGGELVLHLGSRPAAIKGRAGEAFVYPATVLSEVRPVTAGQRLAFVIFIESLVPDESKRTLLFEIRDVLGLEGLRMDMLNRIRLEVVILNLLRKWSR